MYHIVKPITEWRHYDCDPKPGARPMNHERGGEPMFDIHDVQPMSSRGHHYLDDLHRNMHRQERDRDRNYERDRHQYDALQMQINPPMYAGSASIDWAINPMRKEKMADKMSNNRAMAEALLDNFHTVLVMQDHGNYVYKVPKDLELEPGDMVVVPGRNQADYHRVCKVSEVHGRVKNPDELQLKWIIQKLDMTEFELHEAQDEKAMETILELEKRRTKRELLSELTGDLDDQELLELNTSLGIEAPKDTE